MLDHTTLRTGPLPDEMRILLKDYPRNDWENHPGFKDKTRQWLDAHLMFRRLGEVVRLDIEDYLDKDQDAQQFASRLSFFGNRLVGNLHGHHGWEDHYYFPELSAADPRFDAGLAILEQDHANLDSVLEEFTSAANRTIKLVQLDENSARDEAGKLHSAIERIEELLQRHLRDEEELAVPIILHHRLRG